MLPRRYPGRGESRTVGRFSVVGDRVDIFSARRNTGGIVSALGDCVCIGIESPRSPHTTK